jgi:methylmalonyl-CoA mutase N-terminal domain/subunit
MYDSKLQQLREAHKSWAEKYLPKEMKNIVTASGIPVSPVYTPENLKEDDFLEKLGFPGTYPFTRGITPEMYRSQFWLMNQYAGFGTSKSTNQFFKYLLSQGAQSLAIAWDLPTQVGLDSDHPMAQGEVGRQGVAVDSLADVETMLEGIPIEKISLFTTANAIGPIYLAWLIAVQEKRGIAKKEMKVNIQNDVLKEFFARGTYIFPPRPSIKFSNDAVEYCIKNGLKDAHPLCACGYHIRESGVNAYQEISFLLSDAIAYMDELVSRGLSGDDFGPRIVAFPGIGIDLFEEVAKVRALRRMWATMMKERYGATKPEAQKLFLRGYTQGAYLTAQQPLNNIVRATIMALAAVLSGHQTLVVASYDEALALPSDEAVRIALRTQQIIAHESGVTNTVDPLGGSYYVEWLTDELEKRANGILEVVEKMGGTVAAIENGYYDREIASAAGEDLKRVETNERVVVGVNKYIQEKSKEPDIRLIDPQEEKQQINSLNKLRKERDGRQVEKALSKLKEAAQDRVNLVDPLVDVVKTYATLGEIRDTLISVWGEYRSAVV